MFNFMLLTTLTTAMAAPMSPMSHNDTPADMAFYEGHWTCRGEQSEDLGSLKVEHAFGERFYIFTWQGGASGTDKPNKTVTYTSYDASAKRFVRGGFNNDGSRIHLVTDGWDSKNTLVWTGEIDVHNGPTVYVRVTETQQDPSAYTTTYETSADGTTYTQEDTGLCTRGA